jgi:ABC-type phosphate transport system substrate-binding protein
MQRRILLRSLIAAVAALTMLTLPARADDGVVVIAYAPLHGLDAEQIKRIYTGRVVELDGQTLHPVHLAGGQALRQRFHASVLLQSEDDYFAYWTVRRYIGKGAPPPELASGAEVLAFVQRTPGAIGYVDASELKPGVVVVYRR